jgi:hypothetical protein
MRDYKKEYANYQGRPEQIKNRASRNKARRLMIRKVGKARLNGKDVDHKHPIRRGGTSSLKNLRIRSVKDNRSDNGHHRGE